jgi:hypothetical protein
VSSSGDVVTLAVVSGTDGLETNFTCKVIFVLLYMSSCHSKTVYEPFSNLLALWVPFLLCKEDRFPGENIYLAPEKLLNEQFIPSTWEKTLLPYVDSDG